MKQWKWQGGDVTVVQGKADMGKDVEAPENTKRNKAIEC